MARLYADENFPQPVVELLRRLGHDVLTIHEAGKAGLATPDEEVLAFAAATGRALLTLNRRHFIRLHQDHPKHAGLVVCTFDPNFDAQAHRIDSLLRDEPDLAGHLLRVRRPTA